jgi:hypothetical protein
VGKSGQNFDKGIPKRRVKDDDEDDFDWRQVVEEEVSEEQAIKQEVEMDLKNKREREDDESEE